MFATRSGRLGFLDGYDADGCLNRLVGLLRSAVSAVSWGRRALCGLRGHVMVLHFEPARLSLRCLACGAETPGWTIDVRPAFRRRGQAHARIVHSVDNPIELRAIERQMWPRAP